MPAVSFKRKKRKEEGCILPFLLRIIDPGLVSTIVEDILGMSFRLENTMRDIVCGAMTHISSIVKGMLGGWGGSVIVGAGSLLF